MNFENEDQSELDKSTYAQTEQLDASILDTSNLGSTSGKNRIYFRLWLIF